MVDLGQSECMMREESTTEKKGLANAYATFDRRLIRYVCKCR